MILIINSLWHSDATPYGEIWVNIGSGYGLLPGGTKPLPEPDIELLPKEIYGTHLIPISQEVLKISNCRSAENSAPWWMMSSNGNIFRVTGHLCGEFTDHRWISRTKVSDAELWCFLDMRLNKRLSKQPGGWWFETPSRPLWRHSNGIESHRCEERHPPKQRYQQVIFRPTPNITIRWFGARLW